MIYLDNSATTRTLPAAAEAAQYYMSESFFNPAAAYSPAVESERAVNAARARLAGAMNAAADEIVFTSGGTESNNMAIYGSLGAMRGQGRLVVSAVEHPSVYEVMKRLSPEYDVVEAGVDQQGRVDVAGLAQLVTPGTRFVSVMQVNNETGAINDIPAIYKLVKREAPGALLHVDGVQGFMRLPVDMRALGIDSYALSGHKIHGPKGIGALVMGPRMRVAARMLGGGQEKALRSGTENTPGIAGLLAAIEAYPRDNNMRAVKLHLYERLREIAGENFRVNGPDPASDIVAPHILNCSLVPVRSETMLYALEGDRVYVANGSACSSRKQKLSPVLSAMNVPRRQAESAIRFSICPYTTMEQVDFAADCIARHYEMLKRYERR